MLCVRNSFLSFEERPAGASTFRRTKSAEDSPTSQENVAQVAFIARLNEVIHGQRKPGPLNQQTAVVADESLKVGHSKATAADAHLKQVQSTSSVSTMATDSEEVRDEHHQYYPGLCFQHCFVPKSTNLAEKFARVAPEARPTTMMIRNIPNRYSQRELIGEIEGLGFAGSFDFFYAPIDSGTMGNVGYAFVNFVSPEWAERCQQTLTGYAFRRHQQKMRRKIATVSVAHLQGLQANIRHYENAAVNGRNRSKRCGPVIMTSIASAAPASA